MRPQRIEERRGHSAVHIRECNLLRVLDDCTLGRGERAGVPFAESIDLCLRETRLECSRYFRLVARTAAMDQRELEARELLESLLDLAAEEHFGIELVHD